VRGGGPEKRAKRELNSKNSNGTEKGDCPCRKRGYPAAVRKGLEKKRRHAEDRGRGHKKRMALGLGKAPQKVKKGEMAKKEGAGEKRGKAARQQRSVVGPGVGGEEKPEIKKRAEKSAKGALAVEKKKGLSGKKVAGGRLDGCPGGRAGQEKNR